MMKFQNTLTESMNEWGESGSGRHDQSVENVLK